VCRGVWNLVEWVGAGSPVCEEHAETDSLEDAGQDANSDGINWTLLNDELRDELKRKISG
jgi:hypothetical protein